MSIAHFPREAGFKAQLDVLSSDCTELLCAIVMISREAQQPHDYGLVVTTSAHKFSNEESLSSSAASTSCSIMESFSGKSHKSRSAQEHRKS